MLQGCHPEGAQRGERAASIESKSESKVRDSGCFSPLPQSYFQAGEWGHSTASQPGHFYGTHSAEGKYKWLCLSHEVQGLKVLKLMAHRWEVLEYR